MRKISVTNAKKNLSEIINRVVFEHQPVVLTSRGKPKAVLVGYEYYLKSSQISQRSAHRFIRLGGLWKGTRPISYEELREIRRLAWRGLTRR